MNNIPKKCEQFNFRMTWFLQEKSSVKKKGKRQREGGTVACRRIFC